MISIDANILIYAVDVDAEVRHVRAREIMEAANGTNAVLTEQAILEFFHASTRKGKMSVSDATQIARQLATNFPVLLSYSEAIEDILDLRSRYQIGVWDARILAVCAAHGCTHLLSEDLQDGTRYGGVTVVNPFDPANASLIGQLLS